MLTAGTDALTATNGPDTVITQLGELTTLQSSDQIFGNNGSDTLRVVTDGASAQAVAGFQLSSVEKIEVQSGAIGGTTLGLAGADAALATVSSTGSTSNVALNDLAKLVSAEISNTTDTSLTLGYVAAAVAGATTQNLAVSAASATFNAAGVETVNVTATGANTLAFGTAPTTVNVAGAGTLNLGTLTATTTTVNAAQNSGGVTVVLGAVATATATGGSGADTLNVSAVTGNVTVAAGAGNDTINASSNLTATDVIDGGAGQDTLVVSGTIADAVLAKVTSIETLAAAGSLNVTLGAAAKAAGITAVTADGANALTVTTSTGFDSALTVTLGTGSNTVTNTGNAALTVIGTETNLATAVLTGGTGTDTLQISATDAATLNLANVTGFEVINVVPNATTAGTAVKLVLGVNTVAAGKTLTINAAALTATGATLEVDTTAAVATATVVIVGGSNADTIIGGAGKHNISGGAGADVFDFSGTTLSADTTINGGDGSDILKVASVTAAALANVSNVENLAFTTNTSLNANIPFTSFDLGAVESGQQLTLATGYTNATTVKLGQAGDKIVNSANVALTVNSTVTAANAAGAVQGGTATDTLTLTGGGSLSLASNVTGVEVINLVDRGDAAPADGVTNDRGVDYTITTGNYASDATAATVLTINGADLDAGVLNAEGVMISGSDEVLTVNASGINNPLVAVSVVGGSAADVITGGAGNDTILGGAGNDEIDVGSGDNAVSGGDGDDIIYADYEGNNLLLGGAGNDTFILGDELTGEDSIDGGAGVNTLEVSAGVTNLDLLNVFNIQTLQLTSEGTTVLRANASAAGINRVVGTEYDDEIDASAFTRSVTLVGGEGEDTLVGGAGNDVFIVSGYESYDFEKFIDGKAGANTLQIQNFDSEGVGQAANVYFANNEGHSWGQLTDVQTILINSTGKKTGFGDVDVELYEGGVVLTTPGALTIDGSSLVLGEQLTVNSNFMDDEETEDINEAQALSIIGGAGSDYIDIGDGNDTVVAGAGADEVYAGAGHDSVLGGAGRDYLDGGDGNDTINGGDGTDIIIGGKGKDLLTGGAGNDIFVYEDVSESTGQHADVITDFVSGKDKIFVNFDVTDGATVLFKGNAANFEAAQSLLNVGEAGAVFNQATRTLWVDANRDGTLNADDLQIVLQGVSSLAEADIDSGNNSPEVYDLVNFFGTIEQYDAAASNLEPEDYVQIADSAANLNLKMAALLADTKIDTIESNGGAIIISTAQQAVAANMAKLYQQNTITVTGTTAEIQARLTALFADNKVDNIDSSENSTAILLTTSQQEVAANMAKLQASDTITVTGTSSQINTRLVQLLADTKVDNIDSSENSTAIEVTTAQQAIADNMAKLQTSDTITVTGTSSQIQARLVELFADTKVDNIDSSENSTAIVVTTAQQAVAANMAKLQSGDNINVSGSASDILAAWTSLNADNKVDGFDVVGDSITLTESQYHAFSVGSKTFHASDVVTVNGQVGGSALDASQSNMVLTYTSGVQASIVTFDDGSSPTQLANNDIFNLVNVDVITGFGSGDKVNLSAFNLSGQAQVTDFTTDFTVLRDGSYAIVQGTWSGSTASGSFTVSDSGADSLILFDANTGTGNTAINMVGVVIGQGLLSITDLTLV